MTTYYKNTQTEKPLKCVEFPLRAKHDKSQNHLPVVSDSSILIFSGWKQYFNSLSTGEKQQLAEKYNFYKYTN